MAAKISQRLLTPAEVAKLLRVDPKTVTKWARTGKLSSVRTPGGHRRYDAAEIEKFLRLRCLSHGEDLAITRQADDKTAAQEAARICRRVGPRNPLAPILPAGGAR